ncbi:MAG TPA: S8 family serine peptidase, partial [Candidatus Limnocylindrales bacterium]
MKRSIASLAAICLLLGAMVPTALGADPTRHFEKADVSTTDSSFRPYLADPDRTVTVVLQMDARPVIAAASLTGRSERQSAAKRLRAEQGKLDARIKRLGARVLDRYQYAYNGIKVRTTNAKLADLAALPGVVAVRRLPTYERSNVRGVPYVGAPTAWQTTGVTGLGQTIAVIDSGIDYTHANFGGPGTPEAYDDNDPAAVEPDSFPTAKVIAGHDFAGDDYDASGDEGSPTPAPDEDPLDCGDHGSHVSGIAAGQGVLADHSTYPGPYDASTFADPTDFVVGPGVAPDAKLIALKVFGCLGGTHLV